MDLQNLSIQELDILYHQSKRLRDQYAEAAKEAESDGEVESAQQYWALTNIYCHTEEMCEGAIEKILVELHKGYKDKRAYNPYFDERSLIKNAQ